jgi:uncharacterized membrane protein YeaQ/YmgE (transglycosylase-associated protein family)
MENIGAICFGLVIGWITYRTLRRKEGNAAISDIAAVIGAVGGAGITTLFGTSELFSAYCIGLAIGFFGYFVVGLIVGKGSGASWMMAGENSGSNWMGKPDNNG